MEFIYKIENKVNGKVYVGKSKEPNKRIEQHKSLVGKKRHKFYDAIKYYGWDNFVFEIIDSSENNINELETFYIKKYDSIDNGYNYTTGGDGGDTFTNRDDISKLLTTNKLSKNSLTNWERPEYRENQIEKMKKNWERPEYREKIILNQKKTISSDEYKLKQSKLMKQICNTDEVKKKRSENAKGSKNSRWLGNVIIYKDDIEICRFETAVEASKYTGISEQTIRNKARSGDEYKCIKKGKQWYGVKFKFQN